MLRNRDNEGLFYDYCDKCKCFIHESYPRYEDENTNLCWDCAFKEEKISEDQFLKHCGVNLNNMRAKVYNGEIYITFGNRKFPFERTEEQDIRNSKEYSEWRKNVFERDDYTCQMCGKKGGTLNAHHIKSFKKYPKLRLKLSNGVTLCDECHRKLHKKIGRGK